MKILVLGAGGVGGLFGGRILQAGGEVSFLVRERRREQLRQRGLVIESPSGDATLDVDARLQDEIGPDHDLVLLTCKAYDLPSAIEAIRPAMGGRAAVLPLLNGLAHIDLLNAEFGPSKVIGGTARVQATLTADGVVRQLNDWQQMVFGEQDGSVSRRLEDLKALLDRTPIQGRLSTDIARDMWLKLVHLSTIAGLTCLMRANLGEIARTPEGSELLRRFFDTNVAIATHFGHRPDEKFIADYRALFDQRDLPYEASMLRDIERGGPVEADQILGDMLKKCREAGQPDLLHRVAYTHVKAYEERRAAARLPG
jgi:2-dehydropantoate 2-reductase